MYAQLGDIIFEGLKGFDSFTGKEESSLAEQALIDGRPMLQKTGDKLTELQLAIRINSQFADPEQELQKLRTYKENGSILALITGRSRGFGDFVIKELSYTIEGTTPTGSMVSVLINLTLVEYYDPDQEKTADDAAKVAGFANLDNLPPTVASVTDVNSQEGSVMKDLQKLSGQKNTIATRIADAKAYAAKAQKLMDKANAAVSQAQTSLNNIEYKINNFTLLPGSALSLLTRITGLRNTLTQLSLHLLNYDLQNATNTNGIFQNQMRDFNSGSSQLANWLTLRK